jgi:hypothetical protein
MMKRSIRDFEERMIRLRMIKCDHEEKASLLNNCV